MYFKTKYTLKNNQYYNIKHAINGVHLFNKATNKKKFSN
jgi:hypothetical protein